MPVISIRCGFCATDQTHEVLHANALSCLVKCNACGRNRWAADETTLIQASITLSQWHDRIGVTRNPAALIPRKGKPSPKKPRRTYLVVPDLIGKKNAKDMCFYCQTDYGDTDDHVVPKSKGGTRVNNLVPACRVCNGAKGDMTLDQWKKRLTSMALEDVQYPNLVRTRERFIAGEITI